MRPSFEELAGELMVPLTGYLRKMTGNAAEADDVLQETLLRIATALPTFEGRSSVKTWAYRIATNVAIDHARKNSRAQVVEIDESDGCIEAELEDGVIVSEMNACVRAYIDSLPPDYRSALVLSRLEGHSVAEVAEIAGISVGAAKVRIHRATARLREALERNCDLTGDGHGNVTCEPKAQT